MPPRAKRAERPIWHDYVAGRRKERPVLLVAPAPPPLNISEAAFQHLVGDLAMWLGWRYYHTHDSRLSQAGFPDCVFIRPPLTIFAELKTQRGRVQPEQLAWAADLRRCGGNVVYKLWRPSDWADILATLAAPPPKGKRQPR